MTGTRRSTASKITEKSKVSQKSNLINPKPKKKSTKGKKNWRKNIDISDIEKNNLKKDQEELIKRDIQFLKDQDLFVIDNEPTQGFKNDFLGKKTNKDKKPKKISRNEERKIKRIKENMQETSIENNYSKNKIVDLWNDETQDSLIKFRKVSPAATIKFPKLPIPHPGQSYNPSKQDITSLLHKIVDHNKRPEEPEVITAPEVLRFDQSESEDGEIDLENFKVANNPAVDDFTQRKTKTEKNKSIQKKLNIIKERELKSKKDNKIKLANEKSLTRIEKERSLKLKELEEKKKEEKRNLREKEEMIKKGFIEDAELLKDFQIKKEPIPLRKMKPKTNVLSERFENILKRNIIGEYSLDNTKKKNRKLNKLKEKKFDMGVGGDYGFCLENDDQKLKIFE